MNVPIEDREPAMAIPQRCSLCPVQASSLCGAIGEEAARALSGITHRVRVPPGRTIYGGAHQPRSFAILLSGVVKLVIAKPDGRHQIVGLQFPSDFVGRPLSDPPNLSAEAATPLELCSFSERAFEALLAEHPDLERALLARIAGDLDTAREWTFLLGRTTAQEKVATLLQIIAERMTQGSGCVHAERPRTIGLSLPISRMEMAECLGLRLETVSRQLTRLKSHGIIATSGRRRFEILDMDMLKRCASNAYALSGRLPAAQQSVYGSTMP